MKKFTLIIYLFSVYAVAQNHEITYTYKVEEFGAMEGVEKYIVDHFKKEVKKYNKMAEFLKLKTISSGETYSTRFNKMMQSDEYTSTDLMSVKTLVSSVQPIYYDKGTSLAYNSAISSVVIEVINKDYVTWEIQNETKNILGIQCYKATPQNKNAKAKLVPEYVWFAPSLNFKASPSVFGNLPGAVLEAKKHNALITAVEIKETNKEPKRVEPKPGQKVMTYEGLSTQILQTLGKN
ncbi:MAG: GLPGLI family protein [Psychroflexus halocasei]